MQSTSFLVKIYNLYEEIIKLGGRMDGGTICPCLDLLLRFAFQQQTRVDEKSGVRTADCIQKKFSHEWAEKPLVGLETTIVKNLVGTWWVVLFLRWIVHRILMR